MTRNGLCLLSLAAVALLIGGCAAGPAEARTPVAAPDEPAPPPEPAGSARYLPKAAIDHSPTPDEPSSDTVESALIWSEKYSAAMEKVVELQRINRELEVRNRGLQDELARSQAELAQSKRELADANELLIEMRRDLQEWKSNVLGFRNEMRAAQQAQIEALAKVIRLLGGQVVEGEDAAAAGGGKAGGDGGA